MTEIDLAGHTARQAVIDAALVELTSKPIAVFTLDGVAVRAGVDVRAIRQVWPNTRMLFTAALDHFFDRHTPIPDTGTLHGDLLAYARSYGALINSPLGQRIVNALMVTPRNWDLTDSRASYLLDRHVKVSVFVKRACERGECVVSTAPERLIDLLCAGLAYVVLAYGRAVTDDDCKVVVNTLLNGVTRIR
jgi:AcrR family transcriptional regulator